MIDKVAKLFNSLKDLTDLEKTAILDCFNKILKEKEFRDVVEVLSVITDDAGFKKQTRFDTLQRVNRYVNSAKNHNNYNKTNRSEFWPEIRFGEVIKINFAGLGSEHDLEHYAIVWDVDKKRDHIVVIPTTSFKDDTTIESGVTFNIGKIGFLASDTVVLLSQITTISRKRIVETRHYHQSTKKWKNIKISDLQEKRIKEGLRILWLKEKTLYDELKSKKNKMPLFFDHDLQYEHLFRPYVKIESKSNEEQLIYELYSQPGVNYTVNLFDHSASGDERKKLLKDWASSTGSYTYDVQTKKVNSLVISRKDMRVMAYNKINDFLKIPVTKEEEQIN